MFSVDCIPRRFDMIIISMSLPLNFFMIHYVFFSLTQLPASLVHLIRLHLSLIYFSNYYFCSDQGTSNFFEKKSKKKKKQNERQDKLTCMVAHQIM